MQRGITLRVHQRRKEARRLRFDELGDRLHVEAPDGVEEGCGAVFLVVRELHVLHEGKGHAEGRLARLR